MKNLIFIFSMLIGLSVSAQKTVRVGASVAFLNVENLFDTIHSADYIDGTKAITNPAFHRSIPVDSIKYLDAEEYRGVWNDSALKGRKAIRYQAVSQEFTPASAKNYNTKIYKQKLANAARVISEIGYDYLRSAPTVCGLIEVENRQVIEDLINQPALAKYDYGIIHYNSYDARGIDVGLIYQKRRFTPTNSLKKEVVIFREDGKREYTRDILVVTGLLDNQRVAFFMNHWPSRRGGEVASAPKRNAAATVLKKQMDSILTAFPDTKLFAMGDFNDDPVSPSITDHLKAVGDKKDLSTNRPYLNLMYPLYKKGVASLAYRDVANLFDQIIVSKNVVIPSSSKDFSLLKAEIFAPPYLITKEGSFRGYPFRSWSGDKYTGGYSDHFPAYVILQREMTLKE